MTRGAGGTEGGAGLFIVGLSMAGAGLYLLLDSITVHSGFQFGLALWTFGGYGLSGGAMLIPMAVGIGFIFRNARSPFGWILSVGGLLAIVLGVIMKLQINLRAMSMLELMVIVVLIAGGLGLFAKSLAPKPK